MNLISAKYYLAFLSMVLLAGLHPTLSSAEGKHLFVLSGQSNMGGLDPSVNFSSTLEHEFGTDNVVVVKDAHNGESISAWIENRKPKREADLLDSEGLYTRLISKVNAAMENKSIQTATLVWMQGAADSRRLTRAKMYLSNFRSLVDQLSEDLKQDNINFVIGRISDFGIEDNKYPYWNTVRESQTKLAQMDERGSWINTDDLNDGVNKRGLLIENDLHYSVKGYIILGQRFADAAIELIKNNSILPNPLLPTANSND